MTDTSSDATLSNLLHESRRFEPPEDLAAAANVTAEAYERAKADRLAFWEEQARRLDWATALGHRARLGSPPFAKWFVGGKLNVALQLRRPARRGRPRRQGRLPLGGRAGRHPHDHLRRPAARGLQAANALIELGVEKGDRVAIYMPMIPETVVAMLACARIGAPHTVVFGGFSADALRSRIDDCDAKLVITADGGYRRGAPSALKPAVDEALDRVPGRREACWSSGAPGRTSRGPRAATSGGTTSSTGQSDEHDRRAARRRAPALHHVHVRHDGEAQGHPAHHRRLPDRRVATRTTRSSTSSPRPTSTGPRPTSAGSPATSYIVYGPLANGATSVMYEGTPDTPHKGRWWEIIAEVRRDDPLLRAHRDPHLHEVGRGASRQKHDLSSLRLLGSRSVSRSTPRPGSGTAKHIGGDRAPVVDTWWQTETGAIMISPLPGVTAAKPGAAMRPLPGHQRRGGRRRRQAGAERRRRLPRAHRAVAVDAARHLGRRRALQGHLLVPLRGRLLRRRRREEGRGRRHLAARPGRRRHERVRPPDLHHRGGVRAGVATRRSPRRRSSARPTRRPGRASSRS